MDGRLKEFLSLLSEDI